MPRGRRTQSVADSPTTVGERVLVGLLLVVPLAAFLPSLDDGFCGRDELYWTAEAHSRMEQGGLLSMFMPLGGHSHRPLHLAYFYNDRTSC